MNKYLLILCNISTSIIFCVILKPKNINRGLIHFPFGSLSAYFLHKKTIHGLCFIYLISLYQCMEMYGHFILYDVDYSWIDLQGYIIGFVISTIHLIYIESKQKDIEEII